MDTTPDQMDKHSKTIAALDKFAKPVPRGTKPSAEHNYPISTEETAEHKETAELLQNIQAEQKTDPEFLKISADLNASEKPKESQLPKPSTEIPMPEVEQPKEAPAEETKKELHVCPRCSWNQEVKMVKPSEEDIKEFSRSILGSRTFSKTYQLMGGFLKLKFQSLSARQRKCLESMIKDVEPASEDSNRTPLEVLKEVRMLQVLFSLREITAGEDVKEITACPEKIISLNNALIEVDTVFGDMSGNMTEMFVYTYLEFDRLNTLLVDTSFDENFWKGAGLT